jgi:tryptophan halogenase
MNIVIVGGGTAGWIAAYYIAKAQSGKHNITVIESSKLGIIGAGEGSTGSMLDLLNGHFFNAAIDIPTFLKETDGTVKMGIYHKNWTGDGTGYFAPLDGTNTWAAWDDYMFKYGLANYGKEGMHKTSPIGMNFAKGIKTPSAFHFDGHKVGEFFKKICINDGVKIIDAIVDNVHVNDLGDIDQITLDNQSVVSGDFFIDCTGFARVLMKQIGVGWKSYQEHLPLNTAMPFLLDYDSNEKIEPYTGATALSAGWMWNIPLSTRRGCGYVFDKNYISREDAQKEVEQYLGRKIKPIKFIEFDAGRSEVFWKNNVLTLGLASAFVEPLEATSIHSTIIQLLFFVNEYLLDSKELTESEYNRKSYNQKISKLYDVNMEFISFHYQGGRNDTPFWRSIKEKNKVGVDAKIYVERCKHKIPGILETVGLFGTPSACLWNWVAAGIDLITPERARKDLEVSNLYNKADTEFSQLSADKKSYIKYQ